jgi:hypothetical protein
MLVPVLITLLQTLPSAVIQLALLKPNLIEKCFQLGTQQTWMV